MEYKKEDIEQLYIGQNLTCEEIGNIIRVERHSVSKILKGFDIPIKTVQDRHKKPPKFPKRILDYLYNTKKLSVAEIAAELNTNHSRIDTDLRKYGINNKNQIKDVKWRKILTRIPNELLSDLYINQKKGTDELIDILSISDKTLNKLLKLYQIPRRSRGEAYLIKWSKPKFLEIKKQMSIKQKGIPKDVSHLLTEESRRKALGHMRNSPNKPEKQLISLIAQSNLPFKFVGDGQIFIVNRNPDFIYKNLIIEVWGEYHHDAKFFPNKPEDYINPEKRIELFRKAGYETLIIPSLELKRPDEVIQKIKLFMDVNTC